MSDLKVTVNGVEETNRELERRFGQLNMGRTIDKALREGARAFKTELVYNFQSFRDRGHSINEMVISKPMTLNGVRTVVIYWSGPKKRYTIIHLNEFGTIKNPNPRGKGAIERALRTAQSTYLSIVKREIERGIR